MKFVPITEKKQIEEVSLLSAKIQLEYYTPITGREQIVYMLEKFSSVSAITSQLEDGYKYWFLSSDGENFGYIATHAESDGSLFLSKFYIDSQKRGMGHGRSTVEFLTNYCKEHKLSSIWLTVNRGNDSAIAFYKKVGFYIAYSQDNPIGEGFVMNDYVMKLDIL